jgi:hypothetical protein
MIVLHATLEYHLNGDVIMGAHRRVRTTVQGGFAMKLKRPVILSVLFGVGLGLVASDFAAAQPFHPPAPGLGPFIVPRPPVVVHRGPVVIHPGRPLTRPPRHVIVRPPRVGVRVRVEPRVFLPAIVFSGVAVSHRYERGYRYDTGRGYSRDRLVWQGSETLHREDAWTEFILDCNARGTKLWFEVLAGSVQADWAEVVFDNGEVQVVDFPERTLGPGLYVLLDIREGRRVDYVRMVANATSREAHLTLWLER